MRNGGEDSCTTTWAQEETDREYTDLMELTEKRKRIRKTLTWPQLRIACISLGARADCAECGEESLLISHIVDHAKGKKAVYHTIIKLIATKDSISNLAGLELSTLSGFWIYYKKLFRFKMKRRLNTNV